jgi:hypothetical protein
MDLVARGNHAFLMLTHRDGLMSRRIVNRLSPLGPIYVHIDAKTDASTWRLEELPCTVLDERIRVFWGDWSAVEATVLLLEAALADPLNTRFTFISGSHYPIISNASLMAKAQSSGNVIGSRPAPNMPDGSRPEIDYQRRFFRTKMPNGRWSRIKNGVMNRIIFYGRPLDWKSVAPPSGMRAGESYWSLERDFAEYCVQQIRSSPPLINYFKRIVCSDEKVFATLYGEFTGAVCLEGTTFSKWMGNSKQDGKFPAPISRRDIEEILPADLFWFARKLWTSDSAILDWLDGIDSSVPSSQEN